MSFTIRGVTLQANQNFQDMDWLPLFHLIADTTTPLAERKRAAWQGLCEMLPGAEDQADWQRGGKLALNVYELSEVIAWGATVLEGREGYQKLAKSRPGFAELLPRKAAEMVSVGVEDVSNKITSDVFSSKQDLSLPDLRPYQEGDIILPGEIDDQATYNAALQSGWLVETKAETKPYDAGLIEQQKKATQTEQDRLEAERLKARLAELEN